MQISRHWRLNPQRYRLEGFRAGNGQVSIQARQPVAAQPVHERAVEADTIAEHNQRVLSSVA